MRILITGGTGFVGQHLGNMLLQHGHAVAILGRAFGAARALIAAGAQPIKADLRDHAAVVAACRGADVVCHAGALSAPWGPRTAFFATNVGGTAAVIAGCRRWGIARLVYLSSPSVVFNGHDQRNLTEHAPYPRRFASVYSHSKKLGEDLVRAAGVPSVVLRPKAVFGPGDTSLLPRIVAAARAGRLPQIGAGHNLVDLTYVENVAHACALALFSEAAIGHTYHITNGEHVPLWALIRTVLRRLGISDRLHAVPLPLALAGARAMELRALLTGREPLLTRYTARILARTQTYDISAAQRDLGYAPIVGVGMGVEKTLQRMQDEK